MTIAGCSSGDSPRGGGDATVGIAGFRFQPRRLEVHVGATVRWENSDQILHTVTEGEPGSPSGGSLAGTLDGAGTSYRVTVTEPGEHRYFCSRHTSMTGMLIVT
jgi:plastocyanin